MRSVFLLLLILFSASFLFAQKKADRKIMDNLQRHITHLTTDSGKLIYIENQFKQAGLLPKGDSGYWQSYTIDEGKMPLSSTSFSVNNQALKLITDFFPMPYSAAGNLQGEPIISIQEQAKPWMIKTKDIFSEIKNNDTAASFYAHALQAQNNGASGVVFYNVDKSIPDLFFDAKSKQATLKIPVLYVKNAAADKYFADASSSVKINTTISTGKKLVARNNIIGYINYQQPYTIIIGAQYKNNAAGIAALIELARLLADEKHSNYNYLFIAFAAKEENISGEEYFINHPAINLDSINFMIDVNPNGIANNNPSLHIEGISTSASWPAIIDKTKEKNLDVHVDSSHTNFNTAAYFYQKNIPALSFFTGPGNSTAEINYTGELEVIKYIDRFLKAAGRLPKLTLPE